MFVPSASPIRHPSPRERIEAQLVLLDQLIEFGMAFASAAARRGRAAFDDPEQAKAEYDAGQDAERAARSVRLSMALQARLMRELPAIEKAERSGNIYRLSEAKAGIRFKVERAIRADHDDEDAIEALVEDVREQVERDYEAEDLIRRPGAEIVARICKGLGLSAQAWAAAFDPVDLPPLGEVPDAVGERGLQGADARDGALQPPSSAKRRPLPPEVEEQIIAFCGNMPGADTG